MVEPSARDEQTIAGPHQEVVAADGGEEWELVQGGAFHVNLQKLIGFRKKLHF
jgi:hypothetical protein